MAENVLIQHVPRSAIISISLCDSFQGSAARECLTGSLVGIIPAHNIIIV